MALILSLPTIQNWSCHSCGGCCRQHEIIVTEPERRRILEQKWTEDQGAPAGMGAFVKTRGGRYRLANRADGACVFLDEHNRCRIHGKFGEAAKPLACRIYPFAFHPAGDKVAVSLRFSCPSVAGNAGTPVEQQRSDLNVLRDRVVPDGAAKTPPPISAGQALDWTDTKRIVRGLRRVLDDEDAPMPLRIVRGLFVAGMVERATFDKVRGARIDELMATLHQAAPMETAGSVEKIAAPSKLGKTQFRLIVSQYSRRDTVASGGLAYRARMLLAGVRFTRGRGVLPVMQQGLRGIGFAALERSFGGQTAEIEALFARYFDVKLSGMAFCGAAFYGLPVAEGFQSLMLMYPVIMYIARWLAAGEGRQRMDIGDVERAMTIADHHHGYSPAMGSRNFRRRVRWLVQHGELAKLVGWYGA